MKKLIAAILIVLTVIVGSTVATADTKVIGKTTTSSSI